MLPKAGGPIEARGLDIFVLREDGPSARSISSVSRLRSSQVAELLQELFRGYLHGHRGSEALREKK
jgi:hypothetical protein